MICQDKSLPPEIQKQLAVIDQSQWYIGVIIAAIVLSYYSVSIQRKQVICSATDPELCKCLPKALPFQAVSSILIIVSLIYFFNLSADTYKQSQGAKQCCRNGLNHLSSCLVLVAALVRFGLLTQQDIPPDSGL